MYYEALVNYSRPRNKHKTKVVRIPAPALSLVVAGVTVVPMSLVPQVKYVRRAGALPIKFAWMTNIADIPTP